MMMAYVLKVAPRNKAQLKYEKSQNMRVRYTHQVRAREALPQLRIVVCGRKMQFAFLRLNLKIFEKKEGEEEEGEKAQKTEHRATSSR